MVETRTATIKELDTGWLLSLDGEETFHETAGSAISSVRRHDLERAERAENSVSTVRHVTWELSTTIGRQIASAFS